MQARGKWPFISFQPAFCPLRECRISKFWLQLFFLENTRIDRLVQFPFFHGSECWSSANTATPRCASRRAWDDKVFSNRLSLGTPHLAFLVLLQQLLIPPDVPLRCKCVHRVHKMTKSHQAVDVCIARGLHNGATGDIDPLPRRQYAAWPAAALCMLRAQSRLDSDDRGT